MSGEDMRQQLFYLEENFYEEFMPRNGRYIYEAAVADANGVLYVPPQAHNPFKKWFIISAATVISAVAVTLILNKKKPLF
jgi:hypothetical protein